MSAKYTAVDIAFVFVEQIVIAWKPEKLFESSAQFL
jgi:hypothetical protein